MNNQFTKKDTQYLEQPIQPAIKRVSPTATKDLWEASKENGDFNFETRSFITPFLGIDLKETVALEMAKKVIGKYVEVNTENETLQALVKKLDKDNNFLQSAYAIVKATSRYGAQFVLINRRDGSVYWDIISNQFQTNYTKLGTKLTSIKMTTNVTKGNSPVVLNQELTLDKISTHYSGGGYTSKEIIELGFTDENIANPFDFIPAVMFKNYPIVARWGNAYAEFYPDGQNMNGIQTTINQLTNTFYYEARANITRLFIKLSQNEYELLNTMLDTQQLERFFNTGIIITPSSVIDGFQQGQLTSWLEIQSGNPQLSTYYDAIQGLTQFYFKNVGLSVDGNDSVVKSATEVQFNNSSDNETILLKRDLFKDCFKELIIKSLCMFDTGLSYQEISDKIKVLIKENIGIDRQGQIAESSQLLALGLTTPIFELMKINGIDETEATMLWNKIKAFNETELEPVNEEVNNAL